VADALVVGLGGVLVGVGHPLVHGDELGVVVVLEPLFLHEVAEDLDVAVADLLLGEDVVVGDDDDAVLVPDLGLFAEVFVEDADGPGAADVVGHEDVDVDPDVLAGLDGGLLGVLGEDLLGHGHAGHRKDSCVSESESVVERSVTSIAARGFAGHSAALASDDAR